MHRFIILITAIFLVFPSSGFSQDQPTEIDPVVASSDMYTVLLENERVRVVEYQVDPGEKDNWHTHPAKVSYVVSGGTLKITTLEGESFVVEEEVGSAGWFGAVGKHQGENIGTTPVKIVFVEIKGLSGAAEDVTKYDRAEKHQ